MIALTYEASAQTATPSLTAVVALDTAALKEYAGKYKFEGLLFDYMEVPLK
jgi:hypothetical protein